PVDADEIVCDRRRLHQHVVREAQEVLPREITEASFQLAHGGDPLGEWQRRDPIHLRALWLSLWPVVERFPIERLDILSDATIKTRAGLLPSAAGAHELPDPRRHREPFAGRLTQLVGDM